jgi:hypothetical protein
MIGVMIYELVYNSNEQGSPISLKVSAFVIELGFVHIRRLYVAARREPYARPIFQRLDQSRG